MKENTSKAKLFTRGGQITFNNWRMLWQVNKKIARGFVFLVLIIVVLNLWRVITLNTLKGAYYYSAALVLRKLHLTHFIFHVSWHERLLHITVQGVLTEPYFEAQAIIFLHALKRSLYLGSGIAFVGMLGLTLWLIKRGKIQAHKRTVRGARLASPKRVAKAIQKLGASDVCIANIPMVKDFEVKHTLIHGTTGVGKGQTFNQFMDNIRRRGDSAIIFDKGCIFTGLFYQEPNDVILNPFDARCAHWDLWQEAKTEPDFENIAESLIPMHGESDPYWVDAARTVFSTAAFCMRADEARSLDKLLSLILTAELEVLGHYLKGTQAATLVSDKIEKTAISIRSVLSTYLKPLRFLEGLADKTPFAIRDWIKDIDTKKTSQFLFVASNAEQHAALRPLISMWLSMASIALLSLKENFHRRIWFICDELPSLHKLPQLGETIAEVRKFGGCFILGMQSFSQLQKVYGRASATEIFDLLNTRFFFRAPSADMAALVSKELGQEDIEEIQESYSYGANTVRDGISIGTQRLTRPLVSPAEIIQLPDLTSYLRVPADVPVTKIKLDFKPREKVAAGFMLRDMPARKESAQQNSENTSNLNTAQSTNRTPVNTPSADRPSAPNSLEIAETITAPSEELTRLQRQEENILETLRHHSTFADIELD